MTNHGTNDGTPDGTDWLTRQLLRHAEANAKLRADVARIAEENTESLDVRDLLVKWGRRRLVGGQEDMI